ncbi:MAG: amino acid racemase [Candidatus Latescibacterota bacterium]|nr:MAG: amino acid racemase [Candidatus Latescibacterota bacterium]
MKTIGIIGGLGPETTLEYYRIITKGYQERKGGHNYPRVVIQSLNLGEFLELAEMNEWSQIAGRLIESAHVLERAGADFALIASNTPHKVFDEVRAGSPIPVLSIVEATLNRCEQKKVGKVGLFGTGFTMRSDYYQKVIARAGIDVVVPEADEQAYIHNKIFDELVHGRLKKETREGLYLIAQRMIDELSIDGLILGCTELPLIMDKETLGIPFFNTTRAHAEAAVAYCLADS